MTQPKNKKNSLLISDNENNKNNRNNRKIVTDIHHNLTCLGDIINYDLLVSVIKYSNILF